MSADTWVIITLILCLYLHHKGLLWRTFKNFILGPSIFLFSFFCGLSVHPLFLYAICAWILWRIFLRELFWQGVQERRERTLKDYNSEEINA